MAPEGHQNGEPNNDAMAETGKTVKGCDIISHVEAKHPVREKKDDNAVIEVFSYAQHTVLDWYVNLQPEGRWSLTVSVSMRLSGFLRHLNLNILKYN